MAICVVVGGSNGKTLESSTTAIGSCTDYILETASEFAARSPMLTVDDTVILAGSVVSVWAAAYAIKLLRRFL